MKQLFLILLTAMLLVPGLVSAQRKMDKLNRGIVSLPTTDGNFVSWRIYGEESYDVKYNLYRNGAIVARNLNVSNYVDKGASSSATYTVSAVVNGVEQSRSEASRTAQKDGNNNFYLPIKMQNVIARNGANVTADYWINDVSLADLDGDGEIEYLVKRLNIADANNLFPVTNTTAYNVIEAYKLNGTRMWWIDCGPNLVSGSSVELNIVAFDWDQDGKAECVMRGADNMIIHLSDGSTYNIGNMNVNTRNEISHVANMTYTHTGAEYLIYMNGQTGRPYSVSTFPLLRLESGETDLAKAWGDGYGHRSSKYFFGAPYLDGRNPSLFIARGIYTRHKMIAYDINPSTHALTTRWTWENNRSNSMWYGQGNHNYNIADVDLDGRDEIVYGSMVIDDNGHGLATTGLGHGDALHTGDFDPFRPGLETFACNEEQPGNNLRDATTCEILHRTTASGDDGRAMAGNFTDDYPGCIAASASSGVISCASHTVIDGFTNDWNGRTPNPMALNYRIYWDGDLLEESVNSPGIERDAIIVKAGKGRIFTSYGCAMINNSKNNPCATGDIFGDWREELLLRSSDNTELRIYLTPHPTEYRMSTLWHDHQYRQAMCWQMLGYNQPAHVSYFVGETEGFTAAPPAITTNGRTEITSGQTIGSSVNGKNIIMCTMGNSTATVAAGAAPAQAIFNVPSTVEGRDGAKYIRWTFHTCNVSGYAFNGGMRLVKQGEGTLVLPNVEQNYTGPTDIWAGTLNFNGKLKGSSVWLNRHTQLISNGGQFRSIRAEYNSTLRPGGDNNRGDIITDTLSLGYGSIITLDVYGETLQADMLKTKTLEIQTKNWQYGPAYQAPVLRVIEHNVIPGEYIVGEVTNLKGSLDDIIIEGVTSYNSRLVRVGNQIILRIGKNVFDCQDGDYYFRNVATGDFLLAGSSWGTRAITGKHGIDFAVTSVGGGEFTIDSHIYNNSSNHFLSAEIGPYVDAASANWKIEQVGSNADGKIYTIYFNYQGAAQRLAASAQAGDVTCLTTGTSNTYAQWQLLTEDQLVAKISEATSENPVDATFLLGDPNFGRNDSRASEWAWTYFNGQNSTIKGNSDNYCAESFHCSFDASQTLTVPNGTYRVTCQGFYRADGTDGKHPFLYANSKKATLINVTAEGKSAAGNGYSTLNNGVYIPNSMSEASTVFSAGAYASNSVTVTVTDGKLHVGIATDGTNDWVIFDNFEIYCLGPDYGSMLNDVILTAKAVLTSYSSQVGSAPFLYPIAVYNALGAEISTQTSAVNKGGVSKTAYLKGKESLEAAASALIGSSLNEPDPNAEYRIFLATNGKSTGLNMNLSVAGAGNLTISQAASTVHIVKVGSSYKITDLNGRQVATDKSNNSAWGTYAESDAIVNNSNLFNVETLTDGTIVFHCANSSYNSWGWNLGAYGTTSGSMVAPYYYKNMPTVTTWIVTDANANRDLEFQAVVDVTDASELDLDNAEIYDLSGRRLAALQTGINIVRYSDGTVVKVAYK